MPSQITSAVLAALAGAASVAAHGHVSKIAAGGETFTGFDPTAAPYGTQPDSVTWSNGASDNGYVLSANVADPDIICHLDATNAALSATVAAGSDVKITWNQWPESHKGPVIDYMADCGGDCSTVDKTTLKWFKIAEMGQISKGAGAGQVGKWADDLLLENDLTWTVAIPETLKAGNYVLRHELIALHEGNQAGKTQMYPQCINLVVEGTGSDLPEGVVGTSLYTPEDSGLLYNIYNDEEGTNYVIPGPTLASFGSSTGSSATSSATSTVTTQPANAASATSSAAVPTGTGSSTTTAAAPTKTGTCKNRRHARHVRM